MRRLLWSALVFSALTTACAIPTTGVIALDDQAFVEFGGKVTIPVLVNDRPPPRAELSITRVEDQLGNVDIVGDDILVYTAAEGFSGEDRFTYFVSTDTSAPVPATVTVIVASRKSESLVLPDRVDFGQVGVGERSTGSVPATNAGDVPISIKSVEVVGGDAEKFVLLDQPRCPEVLQPGTNCGWVVEFTSQAAESFATKLRVETEERSYTVALAASTLAEILVLPDRVDFGEFGVGERSTGSVPATNAGDVPVSITEVRIVGRDADRFALLDQPKCPENLETAATCSWVIEFTSSAPGTFTAELQVETKESLYTVALAATTFEGSRLIIEHSGNFGEVEVGTSPTQKVITIANRGDRPLVVKDIDIVEGDVDLFQIADNRCPSTVASNDEPCGVDVQFAPAGTGNYSTILRVTTEGSVDDFVLSGVGFESVPPNEDPVAADDYEFLTRSDTTVWRSFDVTGNDLDPEGAPVVVTSADCDEYPECGWLDNEPEPDGSRVRMVIGPGPNEGGVVSIRITYTISDGADGFATATLILEVDFDALTVPDVIGEEFDSAVEILNWVGFDFLVSDCIESENIYQPAVVVGQVPGGGSAELFFNPIELVLEGGLYGWPGACFDVD